MTSSSFKMLSVFIFPLLFGCSNNYDYQPPAGSQEIAITHVSFGNMEINGKNRKADLVIDSTGEISTWGFNFDTHLVEISDIANYISDKTKVLIIGTGYQGQGALNEATTQYIDQLRSRCVDVYVMPTSKAAEKFNSLPKSWMVACFHLNC